MWGKSNWERKSRTLSVQVVRFTTVILCAATKSERRFKLFKPGNRQRHLDDNRTFYFWFDFQIKGLTGRNFSQIWVHWWTQKLASAFVFMHTSKDSHFKTKCNYNAKFEWDEVSLLFFAAFEAAAEVEWGDVLCQPALLILTDDAALSVLGAALYSVARVCACVWEYLYLRKNTRITSHGHGNFVQTHQNDWNTNF